MASHSMDTSKRVAIITGCSEANSLGAAFSRELLARDWVVFATARKEATLTHLRESGCHTLELDVCSEESVSQATQKLVTLSGGRVDLLINNAGATGSAPLVHTDPAKLAAMHDLHVLGPLRLAQAMYPYLKATAASNKGQGLRSKIVNIGSVIANGMPWHTAYATTKAGVQILSDVMRREFAPVGIDVITVELALVQTAMSTGIKDFPLTFVSVDHSSYDARGAIEQAGKEFHESGKSAPSPASVAGDIINAVEKKHSPGKLYLGKNSFIFRHVLPHLPVSAADALLSKIMRVDLVK